MAEAVLKVEPRESKGKQPAKKLRNEGVIPGVLYGSTEKPTPISINGKELMVHLNTYGRNKVINLVVGSSKKKTLAFIYEIQHAPMTGKIIHVDFKHIALKEKINATVAIHLVGIPEGVKNEGGIIDFVMHKVEINCLATEIPDKIDIDVSGLHLGAVVHVKDINQEKFEIITEQDGVIVHIVSPKVVAVKAEEEAEVAETVEPEVIGKKPTEE